MTDQLRHGAREHLRNRTRQAHQRTDDLLSDVAPVSTRTGYERFLVVMLDAFTVFGPALDWASSSSNLPEQAQIVQRRLRADLLAVAPTCSADAAADPSNRAMHSLAMAFGAAYALEGASLGASVLRRRVASECAGATSYFDAVVENRKQRWPKFVNSLDTFSTHPDTCSLLESGALAVFHRVQLTASKERPNS